jgi:hypothetical protein
MTDDEAISLDHLIRPLQEHVGSAVLSDVSLPDAPVDHSKDAIHGTNQADAYGKRNAVEGEILVRIPLSKVSTWKGIAD